jgi:hypothetical protein
MGVIATYSKPIVALMSEKVTRLRSDYESYETVLLRIVTIATNFPALTHTNLNFWDIFVTPRTAEFCLLPDLCWFLAWLNLRPWRWRWYVPAKCTLTFNGIHSVMSQNIELFISTAVRTPIQLTSYFVAVHEVAVSHKGPNSISF